MQKKALNNISKKDAKKSRNAKKDVKKSREGVLKTVIFKNCNFLELCFWVGRNFLNNVFIYRLPVVGCPVV